MEYLHLVQAAIPSVPSAVGAGASATMAAMSSMVAWTAATATSAAATATSAATAATQACSAGDRNMARWAVGGSLVGAGVVVGAPLALGALGFSAAGPVLGSAAAGVQSVLGNVAAGSLFAACQSTAMVGVAGSTIAAGAGVGVAAGAGVAAAVGGGGAEGKKSTA